ncbi:MAG: hypothetical protein Q8O76_01465, partial [Chloroflexota bacterium]|nr:hypothetical protein [Chloroflexota bacterium]
QDGKAIVTDLEVAVSVDLPEATDPCLLPPDLALEFLKGVPGHLTATLIPQGRQVTIACGTAYLITLAVEGKPEDFPPVPAVEGQEFRLDGDRFVPALAEVGAHTATEDSRPVLTGVHLTLGPEVKVCGADGFTLAVRVVQRGPEETTTAILPRRALTLLPALWKKAPKQPVMEGITSIAEMAFAKRLIVVTIDGPGKRARLSLGTVNLTCVLVEGSYPHYSQLIPNPVNWVRADAAELRRAVTQVSRLAREDDGIVRLEWTDKELRVSAGTEAIGQTRVTLNAECRGPGHVALNSRYLSCYLVGKDGPVTLYSDAPSAPTRWEHDGSALVVIMPMFVQW